MYADTCILENRPGLVWLKQMDDLAIVANGARYQSKGAERFALVNTTGRWVYSVHETLDSADAHLSSISGKDAYADH